MSNSGSSTVVSVRGIPSKIGWQLQLFAGITTLVLGAILAFNPDGSLNFICAVIGFLLLLGGVFNFLKALDDEEEHRTWLVFAGILQVVLAVVVFKHLEKTGALIGLLIGISWIVQGIVAILAGALGRVRGSRFWPIFFGLVSLAAGIVVVAVPLKSIHAMAILAGIWFMIIGLLEIMGGFMLRSELKN